jgi:uncharacterized protein (DUF885 family)
MRKLTTFFTAILLGMLLSGGLWAQSANADADAQLQQLILDQRAFYYRENPGTGPRDKAPPKARTMRRVAEDDQNRRAKAVAGFLQRLGQIEQADLDAEGRLNHQLLAYKLKNDQLFLSHRTWRLPLFSDSGFHTSPARMWRGVTFHTADDYQAYIERLADLPRYLAEHTDNLRQGMADGFTMPKVVLDGLLPSFKALVVEDPTQSPFYKPFLSMAAAVSEVNSEALSASARHVIAKRVMPAYAALATFMEKEYYPVARMSIGASELPDGPAYYKAMIRYYTTLDVSPDDVHQLGLREVARIRTEMEQVIKDSGFKGSFAEFLVFLRTDPQFYAKSEKQLLMTASYIAKQIDGRLPKLFGKLPRQPYGVEAVPASIAPNYTTGRYVGAPRNAPRGGYYWVNTYNLKTRPLYTIPALTLHEAMPGHHLQIALSAELPDVPEFRQDMYPHAFGEGWGLYSEKLGLELGVYQTPYEHFGRLSYEMWRACRLVIDTGIHAKGWTRAQAIKLLEENSALSKHNIRTEVDRYIAWPGQATAYKMGELKLLELRARATKALGSKFDVRVFHDKILSAGGIPLYILEARIDKWIAAEQAR